MKDQSDWWSFNNGIFRRANVKPGDKNITPGTFEIAGVGLGEPFEEIAAKMGKATVIERGDASTGRANSKQLSIGSGTNSGLKLGLTHAEVEAILGQADAASDDKFVYFREARTRTTPAEFETLRKDYPDHLSDREAHKKFDFYSTEIYIEVHFGKSGLNYLAVSKSGLANRKRRWPRLTFCFERSQSLDLN